MVCALNHNLASSLNHNLATLRLLAISIRTRLRYLFHEAGKYLSVFL
jgi:hypothetical protein